ncbi:MAG: M12 family metallo-peptidase [Planctomycetota bacterium]|jgi:hypothetical protein
MRFRSAPMVLACAALFCGTAAAQQTLPTTGALPDDPALREALSLHDGTIQELALPTQAGEPFTVTVMLDAQAADLVLMPHSVRSDKFQLLVQGADGKLVEHAPAPPTTYQGWVAGESQSFVAGSLVDGELTATIHLAPGLPSWGVQPISSVDPTGPRGVHVVYDSGDLDALDVSCGTEDIETRMQPELPGPGDGFTAGHKICEIGLDADFEFYTKNGSSVTQTQNDMENIINAVESIYDATAGIHYEITTMIVRTAEPDPYSSTSSGTLLNQFGSHWNSSQGSVQRDVAHLFTGKNLSGSTIGVAWLNVICNKSSAYGLSQSKFSGSFTYRTALTAHELGHNWNASHCDGQGDCKIMCSGLGGCTGGVTSFGSTSDNKITNKKNSVNCLSDVVPPPPPVITSMNPGSVSAFLPETVTVFGSGLGEVNKVTVGGIDIVVGNGLQSVTSGAVVFIPPAPSGLGSETVTLTNPGGTSNGLSLGYVETDPPKLTVPSLPVSGATFTWSYGGGVNDFAFLILALSNTTFMYQGQPVLANSLTLVAAPLDAAGLGGYQIIMPAAAVGLNFWSQVVTLDGGIAKTSNITFSWVPF